MSFSDPEKKVLSLITEKELVELAVEMGNIYSPAGHEKHMGEFVFNWLKSRGFEAIIQEVVTDRNNVVGSIRGRGGGSSLLFNSHLDCDVGGPGEEWVFSNPDLPQNKTVWVEDDRIFGKAVLNDRGPMAAFMIAAKAIKESGVRLKGDLLLTTVVGEIGMAPVDEFQGTQYLGKGLGSRHLVNHGVVADYALVAETTDFGITWAEAGVAYVKITLHGEAIYTPRSYRPERIEDHPNAIVKMAHLIQALEDWGVQYEKENTYGFSGGEIVPKVVVGAIRGGIPFKPFMTSGICSIYVDVRLPPGKSILQVKHQLGQLVRSLNMEADIQVYLYRPGYEGENVSGIVKSVEDAYSKICKKKPERVPTPVTSMWRDINVFNEVGIPAITFGPPRCGKEGLDRSQAKFLHKHDLINTAKIYALVALDICGVETNS
ncbi:MAG: M20/M25/M40 family metallo-hydrolase [Thermodesulfobacteriota bacterium]